MYGFTARYRYENKALLDKIHAHLPMDQFLQGNFSSAEKIVVVYQQFLAECLQDALQSYIGPEYTTVGSFLGAKRAEVQKRHDELTAERESIDAAIKRYKKLSEDLEAKCKGDRVKHVIFKKFKQLKYNPKDFVSFFDELSMCNAEDRNKAEKDYRRFLDTEEYATITEQEETFEKLMERRTDNTKELSHKKNFSNIENQLAKLNNGQEKREIQSYTETHVEKVFQKREGSDLIDKRDAKQIWIEAIAAQVIINKNVPFQKKHTALLNFEDKTGLFAYIADIYNTLHRQEFTFNISSTLAHDELRKRKMDAVMRMITDAAAVINSHIAFVIDPIRPEDIAHIDSLLRGEKKAKYHRHNDQVLMHVFRRIKSYYEEDTIEEHAEVLWNYDFRHIDHEKENLKKTLFVLYEAMEDEDKGGIAEYDVQRILSAYRREKDEQLKLQGSLFSQEVLDAITVYPERKGL